MARMWPWITLVVAMLILAGIAQTGYGRTVLRTVGLSPPSGSYTALSFANPQELPTRLRSKVSQVQVSFAIRNASNSSASRVYNWVILLSHSGRSLTAAAGQVMVPFGAVRTVNKTVRTSCAKGQLQLTVRLANPAEHIDFWTACWSSKRKPH